jgi:hypothetical protein
MKERAAPTVTGGDTVPVIRILKNSVTFRA